MSRNIVFLITFILFSVFCKSQKAFTGNYIGQTVIDFLVITIEVKENHKYIFKTYDLNRKLKKKIKGKWTIDGDKLVLQEKHGTSIVLEKFQDIRYIVDKSGNMCLAKLYKNKDQNEYWAEILKAGC